MDIPADRTLLCILSHSGHSGVAGEGTMIARALSEAYQAGQFSGVGAGMIQRHSIVWSLSLEVNWEA